jgi:hypothetical protein
LNLKKGDKMSDTPTARLSVTVCPKFALGQIVATPNALAHLTQYDVQTAINSHVSGNWGDVDEHDWKANDRALEQGTRLVSAYESENALRFWIITEWDRSITTILLPEDY